MAVRSLLLLTVTLAGCVGVIADDRTPGASATDPQGGGMMPPPSGSEPPPTPAAFVPGQASLRLLTVSQYENSVRDLLGSALVVPRFSGWQTALQGAQGGISPQLAEQLETIAFALARSAFADTAARTRIVGCDPTGSGAGRGEACVSVFLRAFIRRAWRRPPTDAEVARYADVVRGASAAIGDPWRAVEFAVAGVLQSPHFLYRAELGERVADRPGMRRFTSLEMASVLAFFLWNSTPDDALLDAGERGDLAAVAGVTEQSRRLLASPRARQGLRKMFEDALDLHTLPGLQKDATIFPDFGAPLAGAMHEEVLRVLDDHLFAREGDLRDLFVRRETFVNNALARLYGLPTQTVDGFRPATWPDSTPRAGLLGFAGLLALQANQLTASPTLRGKHVREAFLCLKTPPPPAGVDTTLPPVNGAQMRTTRQRLVAHQTNPGCATCHALMDPIGFALENFDAVGAYRAVENGLAIDPSGTFEEMPFSDARGLADVLRNHAAVGPCFARQMYRYAVGRIETDGEEAMIEQLADALVKGQHKILPLAEALATSEWFRLTADGIEGQP